MRTKFILIFLLLASALSAQTSINVTLLRGDSKTLTYVTNGDYAADAVHFTVKKDINLTSSRVIDRIASSAYDSTTEKTTFTIALVKMDTWGLAPGNYVYDIEADSPTDTTFSRTLFRGIFTIVGDVRTPYDNTNLTLNSAIRYIPVETTGIEDGYYVMRQGGTFVGSKITANPADTNLSNVNKVNGRANLQVYSQSETKGQISDSISAYNALVTVLLGTKTDTATVNGHIRDINNPHSVTKTQVGLGNVDNTSDLNKPISSATQTALNAKQDLIGYTPARLDSVYYKGSLFTKTEINSLLSGKQNTIPYTTANADSVYKKSETYNKTEIDAAISGSSADSLIFATHNWVNSQNYLTGSSSLNAANISQSASYRFVTDTEKTDWGTAFTNSHTHTNKAKLDSLTVSASTINGITDALINNWNTAFTDAHTHANKSILDGTQESFTTALKGNYDNAFTNMHSHTNKAMLDSLTASASALNQVTTSKISGWDSKQDALGFTPVPNTTTVNGNALSGNVTVSDANLSVTDVTTNNVSTTAHGFAPKLPNDNTKFLDGTGAWSTPAGGGTTILKAIKTADETVTNSSTLQNDDHLYLSVEANSTYILRLVYIINQPNSGSVSSAAEFSVPAGASLSYAYMKNNGATSTFIANYLGNSLIVTCGGSGFIGNTVIAIDGIFTTSSTAGTLQLQWAQNNPDGTSSTVMKKGSYLLLIKI